MSFGENLQLLRKKNQLSQEGLAEMLGVSRQAVSKWELGGKTRLEYNNPSSEKV